MSQTPRSPAMPPYQAVPPSAFAMALIVTGAITLWRIVELFADPFNLSFDEAQYWAWSRDLAFGYFSKPPLVAWVIGLTTAFFGDGEAWVRLGSPLAHFVTALALFFSGKALFHGKQGETIGLWASVVWITLPGVSVSSMLISTDPFLLMFWALALHATAKALNQGGAKWWALQGVWIGLGLLSKYAMVYFPACVFLALVLTPDYRPALKRVGPYLALGLAGVIYSPNIWWNVTHGMASYRHTSENANLSGPLFHPSSFLEFFGGQFGVFGPLLFVALLFLLCARWRTVAQAGAMRLLLCLTVPILGAMAIQAFLSRANANWAATAYPAATLLVIACLIDGVWSKRVLSVSVGLHLLVAVVLYNMPQTAALFGTTIPARYDLLKRVRGWDQVGVFVRTLRRENPSLTPLFDERKVMASLLYYARPFTFDAVMWNPDGHVLNHYELTTSMKGREGQDFLFVTKGNADALVPFFSAVETLAIQRVPVSTQTMLEVRAYRLSGFKGYEAQK